MNRVLPFLLSLLGGAIMALSMAPYNIWPFMFAGFSALYFMLSTANSKRRSFSYGWLFGFSYFACSLWWIANALLVPGNPYSWVWPLSVAGLPAMLAFFPACAAMLSVRYANLRSLPGFLFFISLMSVSEWLRGHILTGFPWNLYGYGWGGWDAIMQNAAWGGPYMLTLLMLFWATLPGFIMRWPVTAKIRLLTSASAIILFALCLLYGEFRLSSASTESHDSTNILIVQPNIKQDEKWDTAKAGENLYTLSTLSAAQPENADKATLIVWPETAVTADALTNPQAREIMRPSLDSYKGPVYLLTGVLYAKTKGSDELYYNGVAAVRQDMSIAAIYDKSHLVPFGEYIPFHKFLSLTPFAHFEGFTQGLGPRTIELPGVSAFSPLVCYEIIFPGAVIDRKGPRPTFILNVTNDAWYGDSPGPRQHLMQARFRAIEEGIPVVRSANTGISSLIDAYGRPLLTIALNSQGAENVALPAALSSPPLYTRTGDWLFLTAALLLILPSRRNRT